MSANESPEEYEGYERPPMSTSETPRCPKRGCGARAITGHPCHDHDCPQRWVKAEDYAQLERELAAACAALHQCLTATGEEAGDADDFRALVNREQVTVDAVRELRKEADAARADSERLDWLEAHSYAKQCDANPSLRAISLRGISGMWTGNIRAAIDAAREGK